MFCYNVLQNWMNLNSVKNVIIYIHLMSINSLEHDHEKNNQFNITDKVWKTALTYMWFQYQLFETTAARFLRCGSQKNSVTHRLDRQTDTDFSKVVKLSSENLRNCKFILNWKLKYLYRKLRVTIHLFNQKFREFNSNPNFDLSS